MNYCDDCDPILAVPGFNCDECKALWTVTEAEWVSDHQLILAALEIDHTRSCGSYGGTARCTLLADFDADSGFTDPPVRNAMRAADHYYLKDTGYPRGTRFCTVCKTVLPDRCSAYICDDHRCTATTGEGSRCGNKAKSDGLCRVHIAQRERRRQAAS